MTNTRNPLSLLCFVLTTAFLLLSAFLNLTNSALVVAQSEASEKRKLLKAIHSRVPVTVVAVRNLQNKHWLRDLEIEVRNDSPQPIYYFDLILRFPDIPKTAELGGREPIILLTFGRMELAKPTNRPTAEDRLIRPGETYIFKIAEANWQGFEAFLMENTFPDSATKKVYLSTDLIIFGDGTGLLGGSPAPDRRNPR